MPENQTLDENKSHLIIRLPKKWGPVEFRELWEYRELPYSFISRDVKFRYKQTALGFLWVIIQPLFIRVIFTLSFGRFAKIPLEGVPNPFFSFAALRPGALFPEGLTRSTTCMVSNADIMSYNKAIRVKGLGKKHPLGGPQENYLTLHDAIVNSVKAPFKWASPSEKFLSAQRML